MSPMNHLRIDIKLAVSDRVRTLTFAVDDSGRPVDLFVHLSALSRVIVPARIGKLRIDKHIVAVTLNEKGWTSTELKEFIAKVSDKIIEELKYDSARVGLTYDKNFVHHVLEMEKEERRSFASRTVNPNDIKPPRGYLRLL